MTDKNKPIFVGFASAGAAGIWSYTRILKRRGYKIDFYGIGHSKFGMPVDYALEFSENKYVQGWQKMVLFFKLLPKYDIWHLNCMEAFFLYPVNLLILKLMRKKIVLTFRGSEVRTDLDFLPDGLYGKSNSWPSYYGKIKKQIRTLAAWRRRLRMKIFIALADKVALTGPFLAGSVSRYDAIIPYARDLKRILKVKSELNHEKTVIFHSPTVMDVKGSEFILKIIPKLKKIYPKLEYRMPLNLKNEELIREMAKADIVIDQLLVGWYGGQAVEAMALGKPVISYMHEPYFNLVSFAGEIPVVNSNIWTIQKDLSELIGNEDRRRRLGEEGRAFAKKYHQPQKIAEKYLELYFK